MDSAYVVVVFLSVIIITTTTTFSFGEVQPRAKVRSMHIALCEVWNTKKHKVIIYLELDHSSSSSNGFILYFPPLIMFTVAAAAVSA